ncbi:MAG: S41 family peptidase [Bacteroidota bacterium]
MKNKAFYLLLCLCLSACSKSLHTEASQNPLRIYDEFWQHLDENYIFFEEKQVDWEAVYQQYQGQLSEYSSDEELLEVMENSLLELRDAHNRIRTPLRAAKSFDYTEGFDIHFSPQVVEASYIDGIFSKEGSFRYGLIDASTVYIYVPKMESIYRLRSLIRSLIHPQIKHLILDVRNNGGGDSNPVPELLGDFVQQRRLLGSYLEKSGPNRQDETAPLPVYALPSVDHYFDVNVVLLINRACYSATSYLAGMCQGLDNFTLIGQVTGGGAGGNAGFELSNGWEIAISVSDFIDKAGNSIEMGVRPDIEVVNRESNLSSGKDVMLERALQFLAEKG